MTVMRSKLKRLANVSFALNLIMWVAMAALAFVSIKNVKAKSPLHETCAICGKAATVSRQYQGMVNGRPTGITSTFYFCDLHGATPPKELEGSYHLPLITWNPSLFLAFVSTRECGGASIKVRLKAEVDRVLSTATRP